MSASVGPRVVVLGIKQDGQEDKKVSVVPGGEIMLEARLSFPIRAWWLFGWKYVTTSQFTRITIEDIQ